MPWVSESLYLYMALFHCFTDAECLCQHWCTQAWYPHHASSGWHWYHHCEFYTTGIIFLYITIKLIYATLHTINLNVLLLLQKKSNSGITVDAISSCSSNPPNKPSDCTVNSDSFFNSAAEWGKANGRTYNSPDHLMVFTNYDVKSPNVVGKYFPCILLQKKGSKIYSPVVWTVLLLVPLIILSTVKLLQESYESHKMHSIKVRLYAF